jgi:hypothetical protein
MATGVAVLIEALDAPAERPNCAQGAIDVVENDAGLIVATSINEQALVGSAARDYSRLSCAVGDAARA